VREADDQYFEIVSDTEVTSTSVKAIESFATRHGALPELARATYVSIIEAISNTRNHAYAPGVHYRRWWLMAYRDSTTNRIYVAVLDNGDGIPVTIHRKGRERVQEKLSILLGHNHGSLILSALKGEGRTRTRAGHRGTGLPKIYELAHLGRLANLVVLSRRGRVTCCDGGVFEMPVDFRGTLLSWEMS
jgi:hypothetical protein